MIERFNFYDVFGFFIPGSLVLLTLWVPFGLLDRRLPTSDLLSAAIAVIVAYIVGHFIQAFATRAYPSTKAGRARSSIMLDDDDPTLDSRLKQDFIQAARREFQIDVVGRHATVDITDPKREAAFFQARETLIANKIVGYAEQHQAYTP